MDFPPCTHGYREARKLLKKCLNIISLVDNTASQLVSLVLVVQVCSSIRSNLLKSPPGALQLRIRSSASQTGKDSTHCSRRYIMSLGTSTRSRGLVGRIICLVTNGDNSDLLVLLLCDLEALRGLGIQFSYFHGPLTRSCKSSTNEFDSPRLPCSFPS